MSEEQQLAEELEGILGRVTQIRESLDNILNNERKEKKIAWRTRWMILFGMTTQI